MDAEAGRVEFDEDKNQYWGHFVVGIFVCWMFGLFGFIPLCCMPKERPKRSFAMGGGIGLFLAIITYAIIGFANRRTFVAVKV